MDFRLAPFDATRSAVVTDIASLHAELLPHSPVAMLGAPFMERFYYSVLPRLGLLFGAVAYVENTPAGFIVATDDSAGFMREGIRRAWPSLIWTLAWSMLSDPRRIGALAEARAINQGVQAPAAAGRVGEMLSFGVRPRFRERGFVMRTGLRISQRLLEHAMSELAARGVSESRAIVDADNLEARMFYLGLGWQPGAGKVPGWRKHTVEFLWRRPHGAPAGAPVEGGS